MFIGEASIVWKILFDDTNHVSRQVDKTLDYTKKEINNILIGDLNLPPSLFYIPTHSYRKLTNVYRDSFSSNEYSWPAKEAPFAHKYPNLKLDHSLYKGDVFESVKSKVLKLAGSDHFPIQTEVRFK